MVLIFSKVQRCCVKGAPNGFYKYKEEFDAPAELAKQLVEANVAGYVIVKPPVQEKEKVPEGEESAPVEVPSEETKPKQSGKRPRG